MVELETVEAISSEASLLDTAEYVFEIENTPMFVVVGLDSGPRWSDVPTRTKDKEKKRLKRTPEKHGKRGIRREEKKGQQGNRATGQPLVEPAEEVYDAHRTFHSLSNVISLYRKVSCSRLLHVLR